MKLRELQYWDKFKVISTDDNTAGIIKWVDDRYQDDRDKPWIVRGGTLEMLEVVREGVNITMSPDTEVERIQ